MAINALHDFISVSNGFISFLYDTFIFNGFSLERKKYSTSFYALFLKKYESNSSCCFKIQRIKHVFENKDLKNILEG